MGVQKKYWPTDVLTTLLLILFNHRKNIAADRKTATPQTSVK
jgi:hypothetical protein